MPVHDDATPTHPPAPPSDEPTEEPDTTPTESRRSRSDGPDALFLPGDDFERWQKPVRVPWDDDEPDPEATTYTHAVRGPEPVPAWVLTQDAARQHELGLLKTGKEADVFLVERRLAVSRVGDATGTAPVRNLLAAKRYRAHRAFRNDERYRSRRRTGNRRTDLAMAQNSTYGRAARAGFWAEAEFETLSELWRAGVAVPYPVQLLGEELMLQFLGDDERAAPRLVETHPTPAEAVRWYGQVVDILHGMAARGVIHGDLSPYNLLVWKDVVYVIDLPQAQHGAADPDTIALLEHDVMTVCKWFERRGAEPDTSNLLADLLVAAMQ